MVLVAMVAALGSNLACGGAQTPARDPVAAATARLEGRWTLREFTPEGALETPLQGLLGAQFGTLEVMFAPGQLTAAGPGVSAARRYRVDQFIGDDISLVIVDTAGVENRFAGRFVGAELHFRSLDEPWRGRGVLERAP
jgi:hypothetical protein